MKTLKKLIEGYGTKHDQGTRKPGEVGPDKVFKDNTPVSKKGYAPAPTEGSQEFVDDHVIDRIKDANGNDDKLFKASNIKPTEREKGRHGYSAKKAEDVNEKRLTMKELKKREEVAQAIERDNPDMPMGKKMAIATSTAKKVAEDIERIEEGADAEKRYHEYHSQAKSILDSIGKHLDTYSKTQKSNIHWGHVGDVRQVHDQLRDIHDRLAETGEYAKNDAAMRKRFATMNESVEEQDAPQFDSILEAVHYHQQQEQDEAELVEAYSSVLESVYDGLEDEAAKQEFLQMLESDEAFDQLMDLVEERLGEE